MPYKWGVWWTFGRWWLSAAPAWRRGRCTSTGTCKWRWDASPASPRCHQGIFRNKKQKKLFFIFERNEIYLTKEGDRSGYLRPEVTRRLQIKPTCQLHTATTRWTSRTPPRWWAAGWRSSRRTSSQSSSHNAAWREGQSGSQWCSWKLQQIEAKRSKLVRMKPRHLQREHGTKRWGDTALTCDFGLVVGQSFEAVSERGEDALHSAKHGAEAQVEQHEEEERRPEGAARQQWHGLGEGNKSEACALHTLNAKSATLSFMHGRPNTKYPPAVNRQHLPSASLSPGRTLWNSQEYAAHASWTRHCSPLMPQNWDLNSRSSESGFFPCPRCEADLTTSSYC